MYLVVNEWLPEYFLREASDEQQKLLQDFLNRFWIRRDILYVQKGSPFEAKIYKYAKGNQQYPIYQNFKKFISTVLKDKNRCQLVEPLKILPVDIEKRLNQLGTNYNSDRYLFETAWQIPDNEPKIIITTDEKLRTQMQGNEFFEVVLLSEFLENY